MRARIHFLLLLLALAFFGLGSGAALAGDKIWVGLFFAENSEPPADATLAPEKLHDRLKDVFGFKHYELVKSDEIELHREWEEWFVPRKDFFIRVQQSHLLPGEPKCIDYEIYKDGFIVAKGKYEPRQGTPLFINGPDFHEGRFIFVLKARPPKGQADDDDD
jgi:hypothetical protein